ncbi:MAG: hypothetical protein VXY94_04960 [Planctomycetota bacterium]|nr:hypothetical protein [Planctomycetota bacterium]
MPGFQVIIALLLLTLLPAGAGRAQDDRTASDRWREELRRIERVHFAPGLPAATRTAGLRTLESISDPRAFQPMVERFNGAEDDVRLAMLDGFSGNGEAGQAALAWTAIHARDPALRNESLLRLQRPAPREVLAVLDAALRHPHRAVAANAAGVVNLLDVTEAIPLLIETQLIAVRDEVVEGSSGGGLIRSGQQIAYVANVIPVFGPGSVAYQPVVGTLNEGFGVDAGTGLRLVCRPGINQALVRLTSRASGRSTAALGYDVARWRDWHARVFLPSRKPPPRGPGPTGGTP